MPVPTPSNSNNITLPLNPILKSIAEIPGPDLDPDSCSLLGPFALAIQALMACIILASLLVKRHREKPRRKFRIWTADVSKQVIGQAFVHSLNVLISASIASLPSRGNPCALYFINIFVDTTIGTFILLLILRFLTFLLCAILRLPSASLGLASGTYPHPFVISWLKQLAIYLLALALLKAVVVAMFLIGGESLIRFGDRVIEAVSPNPRVQVVVVVMIGPTLLNVIQFLLIDSFIRHTPTPASAPHELLESDEDHEEDYEASSDDEEGAQSDPDTGERVGLVSERRTKPRRKPMGKNRNPSDHPTHSSLPAVLTGVHSYPPSSLLTETRERRVGGRKDLTSNGVKGEETWEDDATWARWDEEDGLQAPPRKPSSPVELRTGMMMSERDCIGMPSIVVSST